MLQSMPTRLARQQITHYICKKYREEGSGIPNNAGILFCCMCRPIKSDAVIVSLIKLGGTELWLTCQKKATKNFWKN